MRATLAAWALVTGLGGLASAEPLNEKEVPATAKWLVHVDVSSVRSGTVSQTVRALWMKLPAADLRLKQLLWTTGVDPGKDLHSITLYGRNYEQNGGVVVVRADVNRNLLDRFLQARADFQTSRHGQHQLLGWTENKRKKNQHAMTACFFRPAVLVFGRDIDEVKQALDVLDGKSPGLTSDRPLHAPAAPTGTMIEIRGVGLADVKLPFESPLVRKSKYLIAVGGEHGHEVFAEARVTTETQQVAAQLRAVVDGLLAMSKLRFERDQALLRFLDAVQVSRDEKTVTVQCRWPADEVSKLVEKAWTKQMNRR